MPQLLLILLLSFNFQAEYPAKYQEMNKSEPAETIDSDTILAHHLKTYAAYNLWANRQFSNWLSGLPEEKAREEMVSSFPTIRETLFHLYRAEFGWFSWIKTGEWQSVGDSWKDLSTPELWQLLCDKSKEIKNYVQDWKDADWQVVHERDSGLKMTRAEVFHTVFNHATYHRGQCITMGRQLGLTDPPRTDYVYFLNVR
jgi:uncharacterized damage-inducible protein DinB